MWILGLKGLKRAIQEWFSPIGFSPIGLINNIESRRMSSVSYL